MTRCSSQVAIPAAFLQIICTAGLSAQQQPTFRSRTELVIVDAVVVDKDGNPVRGLKASDFALTDRKKPQAVATFEEISHKRPGTARASMVTLPPTLKLDVASNMTVQADRLVLVFVDDVNIWKGRTDKARALANEIVSRLGTQASMAVLFTSQEGSTQITQDRSQLLAAIDGMKARRTFPRPRQGPTPQGIAYVDPGLPMEFKLAAINRAARASLEDHFNSFQYSGAIQEAAKMLLQEDRRRKAFVLISEGIDADMSDLAGAGLNIGEIVGSGSDAANLSGRNALNEMLKALRRANVALYAIDPRGKVGADELLREEWPAPDCAVCENPPAMPAPAERFKPRDDSQFRWDNPVRRAQDGLTFQSEAAGGFAVTDTDDLTGGLSRILEDLDHYYLLGFYPASRGANDTHPVGLTVPGHPDYKVRFRRGYTADGPASPSKATTTKDPLAELATGVMPKSDLPLRLTAMPLPGEGKKVSVVVTLEVTAPVGLLKESDSKLRDDVSYSVMVVDEKKAKVTERHGRSAKFSLRADDPGQSTPDKVTYQIPLTIDLPPARYQLRASAISKKLGKGGSVYLDITVPDFSTMTLGLTTIALGYADGPRVPVGRTTAVPVTSLVNFGIVPPVVPPAQQRAQNSRNPLPFEPTLSREFAQGDVLRAYLEVVRADASATVAMEIRVIDGSNAAQLNYDRIVGPNEPSLLDLRIPLDKLSPGAFTLRVTVSDGRNTAKTETGFIVR